MPDDNDENEAEELTFAEKLVANYITNVGLRLLHHQTYHGDGDDIAGESGEEGDGNGETEIFDV